jgi:hypothetical protein
VSLTYIYAAQYVCICFLSKASIYMLHICQAIAITRSIESAAALCGGDVYV